MSVVFKAEKRVGSGPKSHVRNLRKQGRVPGVVYGGGTLEADAFSVLLQPLTKELHKAGFYNHVFQLDFGDKVVDVLARDVQFHPVTDIPLHVDFMRVQGDSKVTVSIPLHFINHDKSPALKQGGILNIVVHALELSVPARAIPETLVVDLDGLSMGEAIHLSHLKLPPEWRAVHADRDDTLATIVAPSGLSDETTQAS